MQVSRSRKEKIFREAHYKAQLPKSKNLEYNIEKLVADIWEDLTQRHIPEMLVDLESLKYVPREIRVKMATEPLFISRYE
jgi:hypothetical protein